MSEQNDYAWQTIDEYEQSCNMKVNEAFRIGWNMSRTTNKMLGILSEPALDEVPKM